MSSNIEFVGGMIAKAPHDNAPGYVKARLSIKREELIEWLREKDDEWINVDIKESQDGKWYAAVDSWKPDRQRLGSGRSERSAPPRQQRQEPMPPRAKGADDFADDDIPF
ncbi:MAG: hypothetical protein JF600_04230 [Xanthomonadales bacterium]|nr:hypothetical protein [Xanthomonadales bacterium]